MECGYESQNENKFLDLSLAIRNEGSSLINSSLEMALESFMRTELLEGSNQYSCEVCQKKVNATKGLKIEKAPELLTI